MMRIDRLLGEHSRMALAIGDGAGPEESSPLQIIGLSHRGSHIVVDHEDICTVTSASRSPMPSQGRLDRQENAGTNRGSPPLQHFSRVG